MSLAVSFDQLAPVFFSGLAGWEGLGFSEAVPDPAVEGAVELAVGAFVEGLAVVWAGRGGLLLVVSLLVGCELVDAEELVPGHVFSSLARRESSSLTLAMR